MNELDDAGANSRRRRAGLQLVLPFAGRGVRADGRSHPLGPADTGGQWRSIRLGEQEVRYLFRQRLRKTIGFTVDRRGLLVSAPRWVSMAQVDEALREKTRWIHDKLTEWSAFEARLAQLQTQWRDGGSIRYLGDEVRLAVQGSARSPVLLAAGQPARLLLPATIAGNPDDIQRRVERWLQRQARIVLADRLATLAARLGQGPHRWQLSSARTLWGSCTHDGVIRLNWRLVHLREALIDYVVAHELAHLRELNHGPAFWKTVGMILPDWEIARDELARMPEHLAL